MVNKKILEDLEQSWFGEVLNLSQEEVEAFLKSKTPPSQQERMKACMEQYGVVPGKKLCELTTLQKHVVVYLFKLSQKLENFLKDNNIKEDDLIKKNLSLAVINQIDFWGTNIKTLTTLSVSLGASNYLDRNVVVFADGVYEVFPVPQPTHLSSGARLYTLPK
jgi:hypothetical protein